MMTLSPVPVPTSLSVPHSALAAPAADLASTRQTSVAPTASPSALRLHNDSERSSSFLRLPAAPEASAATASAAFAAPGGGKVMASGQSSAFLAQLMSQNEAAGQDSELGLAASFARFAPAPTYNTLIGYSIVKFRPSNAGLSSAYAPHGSAPAQTARGDTPSAASEYRAYDAAQRRNPGDDSATRLRVAG